MKKILTLFLFLFVFPSVAFGEVSQFVFVTPLQTVEVGVMSKALTIESRNIGGLPEAVTETTDLIFESSSHTGRFVASSGKTASKTMSKNTARRTFYYIDSTPGTYTLTIKTTGRTSKKTFSLQQKIVVRNAVSVSTEVKPVVVPSTIVPEVTLVKPPTNIQTKKTESVRPAPLPKVEERATSTVEVKEEMGLAAVVYTAPPKTSALESFLWLPRKIWSVVKSIFR